MIDYEKLETKIKEYLNSGVRTVENINDNKNEIYDKIITLLGSKKDNDNYLSEFKIYLIDNKVIYAYDKISYETGKTTNCIVFTENDYPIFSIEHRISKDKSSDVRSTYESYTIYEDNSNRIFSKIDKKSVIAENLETEDIYTLDKKLLNAKEPTSNKYGIVYLDGRVISLTTKDKIYISGEALTNRLNTIYNDINNIYVTIENRLNTILKREDVKEYKVKRKKYEKN